MGVVERSFHIIEDLSSAGIAEKDFRKKDEESFFAFSEFAKFKWRLVNKTDEADKTVDVQELMPMVSRKKMSSLEKEKQFCEELDSHPACVERTAEGAYSENPASNSAVSRPSVIQFPSHTIQRGPTVLGSRKEGTNSHNAAVKQYPYMRLAGFVLLVRHVLFGA